MPANPGPTTRAAVTIGVDQTGGMQTLRAASQTARDVADWLRSEGYDVTCLTDSDGPPVRRTDIFEAVKKYVERRSVQKLVIYFAGHGYTTSSAEIWLLSGAPDDPNEAIDQQMNVELARGSGIPSVVFISDTCRLPATSIGAMKVTGGAIFPNRNGGSVEPEVDRFYATRPGYAAVEVSIDDARDSYKCLFTDLLKDTFFKAAQDDLSEAIEDGVSVQVVTNRRLKACLPDRFVAKAEAIDPRIKQKPQFLLECDEKAFVARAQPAPAPEVVFRGPAPPGPRVPPERRDQPKPATLEETAQHLLTDPGTLGLAGPSKLAYAGGARGTPTAAALVETASKLSEEIVPQRFETQTGFKFLGSTCIKAIGLDTAATILGARDDDGAVRAAGSLVRVHKAGEPLTAPVAPGSVVVQLAEGTGAILASIPGYVAHVSCANGSIANISYVPSEHSERWMDYSWQAGEINELRAIAAAAAQMGVFAVDKAGVEKFAEQVRAHKRLDPTLGLYAALAYAQIGSKKQISSILEFMREDINAVLFDIWLLAGASQEEPTKIIPPCPLLTQTWSYLEPRGVELSKALLEAPREAALWTTFSSDGMTLLLDKASAGGLLK